MTLSYIDALLRDARLVAEYSAAIGGRQDTELVTAIDAVERLPANQRTLAAPQVVALSQVYAKAREGVPFKEFYALRNGWCIFPSFWRRAWTVVMDGRIPNGAVLLILFAVVVFLVGLVSEQIASLRFDAANRHRSDV